MKTARIVSPEEAQRELAWVDPEPWAERECLNLAATVATEPDRIRAAAESAWQQAVDWFAQRGPRIPGLLLLRAEEENPYSTDAAENGSDL